MKCAGRKNIFRVIARSTAIMIAAMLNVTQIVRMAKLSGARIQNRHP
jgi:hypothetical protein